MSEPFRFEANTEYARLSGELLCILSNGVLPVPEYLPRVFCKDRPEPFPDDAQTIAIAVTQAIPMTLERWDGLSEAARCPYLRLTIAALPKPQFMLETTQDEMKSRELVPEPSINGTIWFHGEQSYSMDGATAKLMTDREHGILKRFIDRDEPIGTKELSKLDCNVAAIMTTLANKFPNGAVRRPGTSGNGGYYICVRSLRKRKTHT